jgi:D-beta-D-heptose 7-phosphate kinase/D-beta-D-heptose 1-phosphate adenosyltransferase
MQILENFSKVKVLVFGDVMLDRYWWGSVERISPEAPVPVVRLDKTTLIAGGAANVAANVAGLGAKPFLVGVVGDDKEAKSFPEILAKSNIPSEHLIEIKDRQTTVKTRVIAHSQQIVRLDQETSESLNNAEENLVWLKLEKLFDEIEIIIVSDYAKGVLTENLLSRLITTAKEKNIKLLVDPKGKNYLKYKGATLLTPNKREAAEACKLEENGQTLVEVAGNQLISEIETDAILITKGEEGMTLFEKHKNPLNLKALARDVYDVTGAGDTVIATLAVAIGAGASLAKAAELANISAGIVVEQIGTTAIKFEELKEAVLKYKTLTA